ncbi:hypothetical protein BA190_09590 [Labrys sp. WJW]|uniref:hypothetical protein n=1 Tax=Labrys sp. WJW TaxID=1737983 RepID=UPI00082C4577|nr:hypothetical protein [Labrys sp. WJW]OCC05157.1 hypothetical protein BA190_09590 [Labrys sp. WJW]
MNAKLPRLAMVPGNTHPVFLHPCCAEGCEADGTYGEGVALLKGKAGVWWCFEHWPRRDQALANRAKQAPPVEAATTGDLF